MSTQQTATTTENKAAPEPPQTQVHSNAAPAQTQTPASQPPTEPEKPKLQLFIDLQNQPIEKQEYAASLMKKGAEVEDLEIKRDNEKRQQDLEHFKQNHQAIRTMFENDPVNLTVIDQGMEDIKKDVNPFEQQYQERFSIITSASRTMMTGQANKKSKLDNVPKGQTNPHYDQLNSRISNHNSNQNQSPAKKSLPAMEDLFRNYH